MAERSRPANDGKPGRASEWLVALAEQPGNAALRADFERWLAASDAHARDWAEINRASELLAASTPEKPDWADFLNRRRAAEQQRLRTHRRRRLAGLAALAAAACLLIFFQGSNLLLRMEADYMTATAEQRRIELADGTVVLLGPESAIDDAYSDSGRRVRLLKGAAFFEVAAGDQRPFSVETRDLVARDIGTAFEVRLGADASDVAVREGIVDVSAAGSTPRRLLAGDWARVARDGKSEGGRVPPDQVASWIQGQLIVKDRSVAEVVDALRPYFEGAIVVRGKRLAAEPLTGVYSLGNSVEALRAVARAQGASFHRLSPWLIVISGD
jgi:transmembrane sensor